MPLGRTFTGTPGQPSSSSGGPLELRADIDAVMKALNDAFGILGITLASNGLPDAAAKTFPLFVELASIVLGTSGAELTGYPDAVDNNVYKIIQRILSAGSGTIPPDNSITNNKLVSDIKVGSLALLSTIEKGSVVGALNEVKTGIDGKLSKNADTLESYSEKLLTNATATGTVTLDLSVQDVFDLTLSGSTTLAFSNVPTTGKAVSCTVLIRQGGTAYSLTFPASVKFSNDNTPDVSAINKTHILSFYTVNGGTRWYCTSATNFTT
jgi:hypothetical protein